MPRKRISHSDDIHSLEEHLPKYTQLRDILREKILTYQPNQMIPSEAELCEMYEVSRTTVRKALDQLMYEGLLVRVQGKGTHVAPPKFRGRYIHSSLGFFEDMSSRGIAFTTRVLEQAITTCPGNISAELHLTPSDNVFKLVRVRSINNEPIHLTFSYLPYFLFPGIEKEDFINQSLFRIMREKYGVQICQGLRLLETRLPTNEEARILNIVPEVPLLVMTGSVSDQRGIPIEYGITLNRGDRNQLEIEIK